MKVKDLTSLEARLDRSLGWRKFELSSQKLAVSSCSDGQAKTLRRAGVVLLYAHWEGFVKESGRAYLHLVGAQTEPFATLQPVFQAMAIRSELLTLGNCRTVVKHRELLELIYQHNSTSSFRIKVDTDDVIAARGNVNGETFKAIVNTLGLDYTPYASREIPVIERLVRARHSIAHGEGVEVDDGMFSDLHSHVIQLLDDFKEQVLDAARHQRWRKAVASPPPDGGVAETG